MKKPIIRFFEATASDAIRDAIAKKMPNPYKQANFIEIPEDSDDYKQFKNSIVRFAGKKQRELGSVGNDAGPALKALTDAVKSSGIFRKEDSDNFLSVQLATVLAWGWYKAGDSPELGGNKKTNPFRRVSDLSKAKTASKQIALSVIGKNKLAIAEAGSSSIFLPYIEAIILKAIGPESKEEEPPQEEPVAPPAAPQPVAPQAPQQ